VSQIKENLIIKGARVVSPKEKIDTELNVHIKAGKIAGLHDKSVPADKIDPAAQTLAAAGLVLVPGLVDMHVHLREPGYEYKETIAAGTFAAAQGGITSVACMANTNPVNDNASVTKYIIEKAAREALVNVFPIGAMTKGLKGELLCEYGNLKDAGCVAVSDDGRPVMSAAVMRRVMEYAKTFDLLCISHCEDLTLSRGGQMNEGIAGTKLGLTGIPAAAEDLMAARDIILAGMTGCKLHIAHVSTKGAVDIIRKAKKKGINVTCETAPHYFTLSENDINDYDTNFKVNPPLRSKADIKAVIAGLKDGTIDVVASDHAPHHADEKNIEFMHAACGISGIETMLPLTLKLVRDGVLDMNGFVRKLSEKPAKILGLTGKGAIKKGADADLALIDMEKEYVLQPSGLHSKGKNSPFIGRGLKGIAAAVFVKGKCVFNKTR
jgi:dihydroorotase